MLFELYGCCFEFGVNSAGVVVVDLEIEGFEERGKGFKARNVSEIFLEFAVKGFLESILPGGCLGTERRLDVVCFEEIQVCVRGVFAALIGVEVQSGRTAFQGVPQRLENQGMIMAVREGKPDDFPAEEIEDGTEVPELSMEPEVGEITGPEDVSLEGAQRLCDIGQRQSGLPQIPRFLRSAYPSAIRLDAIFLHDPENALFVSLEVQSKSAMTVAWMIAKSRKNALLQLQIAFLHPGAVVQRRPGDADLFRQPVLVGRDRAHGFFWERDSCTVISPTSVFKNAFSFRRICSSRKVGPAETFVESQL